MIMKKHDRMLLVSGFAFAMAILSACGDEITEVKGIETVASYKKLGECRIDKAGEMVYVMDSAAVYLCSNSEWKVVDSFGSDVVDANENGADAPSGIKNVSSFKKLDKCSADKAGEMVYVADSGAVYLCAEGKWNVLGANGSDGSNGTNGLNGSDGKDGASCTATALKGGEGFKIECDGDSVGVVLNGEKGDPGKQGDKGDNGDDGNDGKSCTAVALDDSTGYKIVCGVDSVGVVLNGFDPSRFDEKTCNTHTGGSCSIYNPYTNTLVDMRDGQTYRTTTIDTQIWMAENLNYEIEESACFNDIPAYCTAYGRLYTSIKSTLACPEGWRLPDTSDYKTLFENVGGAEIAGKMLKSRMLWKSGSNGLDAFGFDVLPVGLHEVYGGAPGFGVEGTKAALWTSTIKTGENGRYAVSFVSEGSLSKDAAYIDYLESYDHDFSLLSVRCIKRSATP
jgi:uncharacterized protein (TIGR02145 family)